MNFFIVGNSGSGKSTLSREIAVKKSIRYLEIDAVVFLPHWQKRSDQEIKKIIQTEIDRPGELVIDGNFFSRGISPAPGDTLIILNLAKPLVVWRVFRRSVSRIITQKELWAGNKEEAKFLFSTDPELNPVLWAWKIHETRSKQFSELVDFWDNVTCYVINSKKELRELKTLL
jgi:adenylate kinase family enzyme